MTDNKAVVTVHYMENGNLSFYGNPSRLLRTSDGTYKTMANAGFVYGLQSNASWEGAKVELSLTPSGRVTNMRRLRTDKLALND